MCVINHYPIVWNADWYIQISVKNLGGTYHQIISKHVLCSIISILSEILSPYNGYSPEVWCSMNRLDLHNNQFTSWICLEYHGLLFWTDKCRLSVDKGFLIYHVFDYGSVSSRSCIMEYKLARPKAEIVYLQ